MSDGLNMLPRIGEPETSIAGAGKLADGVQALFPPNIPDTSAPGPTPLQQPSTWVYDFDPTSGLSRASFNGEIDYTGSGGTVTSWNSRSGAVVLLQSDVTAVGFSTSATNAATYETIAAAAATYETIAAAAATYLPLAGGTTTGPVALQGVSTNSNAVAGQVGEFIIGQQLTGVPLTSVTSANVTSINLSAGDWDIDGVVYLLSSTNVLGNANASVGLVSATLGTPGGPGRAQVNGPLSFTSIVLPTGRLRVSVAGNTIAYLVAQGTFASGTLNAQGTIQARRMR